MQSQTHEKKKEKEGGKKKKMTKQETKEEQTQETNLDAIPEIEVGVGIDLEEYVGQQRKIEKITPIEVETQYDETGNWQEDLKRKVKVLRIETEKITEFKDKDGNTKEIRASELFNMKRNENGDWGISKSPKAKIRQFMKRQNITKLKDLIGSKVILRDYTDKQGNTYLGFVTK